MAVQVSDEAHVQAKLFTKLKRYTIQETPFSLPTAAGCLELSSLLKGLLFGEDTSKEALRFDFLINGEFLRTTLKEFIELHNLATESVVGIEYILKEDAPQLSKTLQHDDWISSVDMGLEDLILTGSYDNTISLWNLNGECISALAEGHTMAVKSVCWIPTSKHGTSSFLTASQDQTILIWEMTTNKGGMKTEPKNIHVCRGHAGSVDCLAVNKKSSKFASGSWDKMIKIWDSRIDHDANDEEEEEKGKRKKDVKKSENTTSSRTPLITFSGHKEPVSCMVWSTENEIISAGWDHCIRLWNVETAVNTSTLNSNKVILDISYSEINKLLVTGSVDKYIRLYDPRVSDGTIVKTSLSSHNGWVSCVEWSPENENHLLSGSYDCTLKVWDIRRNDSPILELENHKDKVMCLNWAKADVILSGGADCIVHVNQKRANSPVNCEE